MKSLDYYAHPSAIVDPGAKIGKGTKIWHFCHIGPEAVIGERCSLGQNVYVGKAKIGNGVKIQNNVSVYDEVEIEDDVFCGPSMVFTNVYNPRAEVSRKDEYRKTLVKKGATIGANATIVCGVIRHSKGLNKLESKPLPGTWEFPIVSNREQKIV